MEVVDVPIDKLRHAEYNPRRITTEDFEQIKRSIESYGFVQPLVVNRAPSREGVIVGGNQRFEVAKKMGMTEVPVLWVDIPDLEREKELNIRLNRAQASWDWNLLQQNFDIASLTDWGFNLKEINLNFEIPEKEETQDVPELPKEPRSKRGEIYLLGRHRLMCGDSTNCGDVTFLMDGKLADMVFTDPPYGIDYGNKNRFLNSFQKAGRNLKDIANDMLGKDDLFDMLVKSFTLAHDFGKDHCSYYVTAPQGGELGLMMMMMMMMMMMSGLPIKHILIWNKNSQNFSLGRLDYEYKHEPILYTWKKTHKFYGAGQFQNSVWDIAKEKKCDIHPTMKPIALMVNAILNSSLPNEIILDLFLGSGSTLIAAEQTGRICYGVEIDPAYCDVIIKRYCNFTGANEDEIYRTASISV